MSSDQDYEELWDALTVPGQPCTSYADIAAMTGWPLSKVGPVLTDIRRPEVSELWGWTVPHVPRGPGPHLFQVVFTNDAQTFGDDEIDAIRAGAVSTLSHVASSGVNEAHALRSLAGHVSGKLRREMKQTATAFEGAAAMAEQVHDRMKEQPNGVV